MSKKDDQRSDLLAPASGSGTPDVTRAPDEASDAVRSGVGGDGDYFETEEYQAFVAECAKRCRCTHTVCAGVLAGGFCDEIIEDDSDEENYPRDEDDDC